MILNNTSSITGSDKDFSGIHRSLLGLYGFSAPQLEHFTNRLTFKKLKRKSLLVKPRQISTSLCFINTGSLRFYTHTERGELTINFFTEHQWAADMESFMLQQPSNNYIEAFEDSDIASISLSNIHELMDSYPCFRMLNALLVKLAIPTTHLATISTKNPDLRYKELLLKHPDWINRFPQMQIASYLGMTPATLSRVRARIT
ncbi:MAG: Crp/Fnr family transcriptional regulator [Chitinophagaceae bacterium]